jgi:hypothetical protein
VRPSGAAVSLFYWLTGSSLLLVEYCLSPILLSWLVIVYTDLMTTAAWTVGLCLSCNCKQKIAFTDCPNMH